MDHGFALEFFFETWGLHRGVLKISAAILLGGVLSLGSAFLELGFVELLNGTKPFGTLASSR
jgi:hypothetical protein